MIENIALIIFALVFSSVFLYLSEKTKTKRIIDNTLNRLASKTSTDIPEEETPEDVLYKKSLVFRIYKNNYEQKFIQAGFPMTFKEFNSIFMIMTGACGICLIVSMSFFSAIITLGICIVIGLIIYKGPDMYIQNKKQHRMILLNEQKTDILNIMISCSKTKTSLDKTFLTLSEELESPAKEVFEGAYKMYNLGIPVEDILDNLKIVFDSYDFNFLLSSYQLWLKYEGKLNTTFTLVSKALRDREEIDLELKGMSNVAKTYMILLVGSTVGFIFMSIFTIGDIFMQYIKNPIGQFAVILSFVIFFFGVMRINKIKNGVKY